MQAFEGIDVHQGIQGLNSIVEKDAENAHFAAIRSIVFATGLAVDAEEPPGKSGSEGNTYPSEDDIDRFSLELRRAPSK